MALAVSEKPTLPLGDVPTGEGLTFEKVWAMFKETDRKFQEASREAAERQKETDLKLQEVFREAAERQKETDRKLQEAFQEAAKQHKETERIIGNLGNRFGELVEHLVAPNVKEKFNELGFCFTKTGMDIEISDPHNPKADTEVDILLENGDIVVAVEVKSKPKEKDVNDHVKRMEILRSHADKKQDRRRYQGAIAGAIISKAVRRSILAKGFYVIEQTGDTIQIPIPPGFKAREW
jgi:hypothetical protein